MGTSAYAHIVVGVRLGDVLEYLGPTHETIKTFDEITGEESGQHCVTYQDCNLFGEHVEFYRTCLKKNYVGRLDYNQADAFKYHLIDMGLNLELGADEDEESDKSRIIMPDWMPSLSHNDWQTDAYLNIIVGIHYDDYASSYDNSHFTIDDFSKFEKLKKQFCNKIKKSICKLDLEPKIYVIAKQS